MNEQMGTILQLILPALAAGAGSVIATRVSVARLEEDVRGLFRRVEALQKEMHSNSLAQERELSNVKSKLAAVASSVEALRIPWNHKADQG